MTDVDPKITQMDEALGRYYLLNNKDDYMNQDNDGKFKAFCEEHEFDDDLVLQELQADPSECQLLDFDEEGEFPFAEPDEDKEIKAHKILKMCYNNANAFRDNVLLPSPLKVNGNDWKVSEQQISDVVKVYKLQLNTIFTSLFEQDTTLLMALAIGYKLHEPYLQMLSDMCLRDSIKDDKLANVDDWAQQNKHIQSLHPNQEPATHAIRSFFRRMCPKLVLPLQTKIQDSTQRTAQIISALVQLVYNTANSKSSTTCPFQMDSCIIFDKVICAEKMENVNSKIGIHIIPNKPLSTLINWLKYHKKWKQYKIHFEIFEFIVLDIFADTDHEFDIEQLLDELEDIEESQIVEAIKENEICTKNYIAYIDELKRLIHTYQNDLDDFKNGKYKQDNINLSYVSDEKKEDEFFDCIGNITQKLINEKLLYMSKEMDDKNIDVRLAHDFHDFVRLKISSKYKGKMREQYPRNKRFVAVFDKRKKTSESEYLTMNEQLYFFEPPNNCCDIPNSFVPEWFFDSSRTCIIPNVGYNNGKNRLDIKEDDLAINDPQSRIKLSNQTITSLSQCKGALMVLSFHVESVESIKCYMYLNGQIHRFFPQDIINLLPAFFDEKYKNNASFATSQYAQNLVDRMTVQLRDLKFESFYNEYS